MNSPQDQNQPPSQDEFITLGIVVRSHGLKGEVKVRLTCSGLDRILPCNTLRLVADGKEVKRVSVMRGFQHQDGDVVLRFREVKDKDEAESLRGAHVAVPASEKAGLPAHTYYFDDLVGMSVHSRSGEDLGKVEEVMEGLANGVFVVRNGEKETLIPALKSVVLEVDLKARKMVVELPEEVDGDTAD